LLQQHFPDFGQGSAAQPTTGDDVHMEDTTSDLAGLPTRFFKEAKGDEACIDAVWKAVAHYQCIAILTMFPTDIKH
jgi:hypothetical protein